MPPELFSESLELDRRHIWATVRCWLEVDKYKQMRSGGRRRHHWDVLEVLLHIFAYGLKAIGLYKRGVANAQTIELKRKTIRFSNLPSAFNGYTILHITDPHLDTRPNFEDRII